MSKKFALFAACAGLLLLAAPAATAIEVLAGAGPAATVAHSDLAALPLQALLPVASLSELPEPEVFAMMLLGLVLIGYRASRDSNETFR